MVIKSSKTVIVEFSPYTTMSVGNSAMISNHWQRSFNHYDNGKDPWVFCSNTMTEGLHFFSEKHKFLILNIKF